MTRKRNAPLQRGNFHKPRASAKSLSGSPIQLLLSKLDKVKQNGKGQWMACCPAHGDKTASLSLRETETGSALVHCFAGCSVHEVMSAIGLDQSDLFPKRTDFLPVKGSRHFDAYAALKALGTDVVFLLVAARMMLNGETLTDGDMNELSACAERLQAAKTFVLGC